MSLIWSTGLIVVRSIIGLAHLWGHQLLYGSIDEKRPMTDVANLIRRSAA